MRPIFLPLLIRTITAPVLGTFVLAGTLIAISGFEHRGYALALGWICVSLYLGLHFPSWRVVSASAFIFGGVTAVFHSEQTIAASLFLGYGVHCLYALTKVRCSTIGCCNFYAYGQFGRGTFARRFALSRVEIVASLILAAACVLAMLNLYDEPAWLLAGLVGHGCIRTISWSLRHPRLTERRVIHHGNETFLITIFIQVALLAWPL